MIEAQVHQQLREFLRECGEANWPHHLTMARLVARSLRVERSALLQVGSTSAYRGDYRISYLVPLLMWAGPCVLVAPPAVQQQILLVEVPKLQDRLPYTKAIQVGDRWPDPSFQGVLLTSPEAWLADRLGGHFHIPAGLPTVIDGVDRLEGWAQQQLTVSLTQADWLTLGRACPNQRDAIHDLQVALVHGAFQSPPNPYNCHLLDAEDRHRLSTLHHLLGETPALPAPWRQFLQQTNPTEHLLWCSLDRDRGTMTLHSGPVHLAAVLGTIWASQPTVLVGAAVDAEAQATTFCDRLGLSDLTCLKFGQPRQQALRLYLPDRLPLPNTATFQGAVGAEIRHILSCLPPPPRSLRTVIIADDVPLKQRLAVTLAAEFGSRVRLEQLDFPANGILVSGWEFWQTHQHQIAPPDLLIITTLPIPSLENPLVAGRVAHYKRQRQDWFRLYLLPLTLSALQQAIGPVRANRGAVALLDTRVHYRSYGHQILDALSPAACCRRLPSDWFADEDYLDDGYL